jgi:hypothetical protein
MSVNPSKPITNADTFINRIFNQFHPSFKKVRVYGTNKEPLFVANDVYAIIIEKELDDEYLNKNIHRITNKYNSDENNKYRKLIRSYPIEVNVKRGNSYYINTVRVNMLTKFGVYRMMADLNSYAIAQTFESFIYIVLNELEEEGVAHFTSVVNKLILEKAAMDANIDYLTEENKRLKERNAQQESYVEYVQEHQQNDSNADINYDQDNSKIGLRYYEQTYGLVCPVYVIDDKWLTNELTIKPKKKPARKPKKKEEDEYEEEEEDEPELLCEIESYSGHLGCDYEYLTPTVLYGLETKAIYLEIGKPTKKSKPAPNAHKKVWKEFYFIDQDHYTQFMERMNLLYKEYCLLPYKTPIWHIDFDHVDNVRLDILRTRGLKAKVPLE